MSSLIGERERVALAMYDEARCLMGIEDERAIACYADVVRYLDEHPSPDAWHIVVNALTDQGAVLQRVARVDASRLADEIAVRRSFVERFGSDRRPDVRERVASTMFMLAQALARRGEFSEASTVLDLLIERFRDAPEGSIQTEVREARVLRLRERHRERARRREQRATVALVYVPAVLLVISKPQQNLRAPRRVSGWSMRNGGAGVLAFIAVQSGWRIKRMHGRRGITRAVQAEFPANRAVFYAVAAALVLDERPERALA